MGLQKMVCCACTTVESDERGVLQTCGKYEDVVPPGFKCYMCWQSVHKISVRVEQIEVITKTKTHDNVTIEVKTSVQYTVDPEMISEAFYSLDNPEAQMTAFVDDVV